MRLAIRTLFILLALTAARAAAAADPPDTLGYVVRLGATRLGTSIRILQASPNGGWQGVIRTSIRLDRGGSAIALDQEISWIEDRSGGLERMSSVMTGMGPAPWRDSIERIADLGLWRRIRARGGPAVIDTFRDGPLLGPDGIDRALATRAQTPPARVRTVDPEEMRPTAFRIRQVDIDTLAAIGGHRVVCTVFSVEDSSGAPAPTTQWRDADGTLWRERDPSLDWITERIEVSGGETARADRTAPRVGFDAATWVLVPIEGRLPDRRPCTLLLEPLDPRGSASVDTAGTPTSPPVANGPGQSITTGPHPGTWILRLTKTVPPPAREQDRAAWSRDPALAGALRPGLIVDSDSPAIRAFADSVAAGSVAGGPVAEALRLERAVHDRIRLRDYATVLGTASQTLQSGSGDCTEHAVLLASVCRARGIPARLVAGMTPNGEARMAWHLWTEAYVGEWIALDATIGHGELAAGTVGVLWMERPEEDLTRLEQPMTRLAEHYRFRVVEEME